MELRAPLHGLLLVLAAACAGPVGDDDARSLGRSESPVIDGAVDETTTAVVGMLTSQDDGDHLCTGTLILPNLVLTARHCVAEAGPFHCDGFSAFGGAFPTESMSLTTTSDVFGPLELRAREFWTPEFSLLCGGDQALVLLDDLVPSEVAVPIVPRLDEPAAVGEAFTAVGFGAWDPADPSDLGVRRRAEGFVVDCLGVDCGAADLVAGEWRTASGHCMGDSGGPALDDQGRLIGVVSRGQGACSDPTMGDPTQFADWIRERARAAADIGGYELPAWATPPDAATSSSSGGGGEPATTTTTAAGGGSGDGGAPGDGEGGGADPSAEGDDEGGCAIGRSPARARWSWLPIAVLGLALARRAGRRVPAG